MTVKRYDAHTNIDDFKSDWHEKKDGPMVRYDDYAALKERDAVVAESAKMHKAIDFATAPDMWVEQHDGMLDYRYAEWYVDVLEAAKQTQATDAALADIEARGVEKLATFAGEEYQRSAGDKSLQRKWKGIVLLCTDFAAQLRKGVGK